MALRILAVVCAVLSVAVLASPAADAADEIAPGVEHQEIRDPAGPFAIHVVTVRLAAASTVDTALGSDELAGFETTSSIARRHQAVVAINGDYALSSGRPVHAYAEDGRVLQGPARVENAFAVDQREANGFFGPPGLAMSVERMGTGQQLERLERVNFGAPNEDQLAGFTPEGGNAERPAADACAARLDPESRPQLSSDGSVVIAHVVKEARCSTQRLDPAGGMTLTATATGPRADTVRSLGSGDRVGMRWSVGWPGVFDLIGGHPVIVHDGEISPIVDPVNPSDPFFQRHPRTGVGLTRDGKVLLVTVDGRQRGHSAGMTLREFAQLFARLGAWRALNLDGGGSTTMVVGGDVVNRPSDRGGERPVPNALLVLPGADPGESARPVRPVPAAPLPAPDALDVWDLISRDAASTGGLSASLEGLGLPLAPELLEAARLFGD